MATSEVQNSETPKTMAANDFIFARVIGEGAFAYVYLAKEVDSDKHYAVKVLSKSKMVKDKITKYTLIERNVLEILIDCPKYFVKMYGAFMDTQYLYFALEYHKNGELLEYICENKLFNLDCARYYAAELVLAIEILHSKGIVHRDIKPENILLDDNWHIRITDFGCAKFLSEEEIEEPPASCSFVGTPEYISPELVLGRGACFATDLWALGCVIFQMVSGERPFAGETQISVFAKIVKLNYSFPERFDDNAKDLVQKLLVRKPQERLGASDSERYQSIRNHNFFRDIDWTNIGEPPKIQDIDRSDYEDVVFDGEPGFNDEIAAKLIYKHEMES